MRTIKYGDLTSEIAAGRAFIVELGEQQGIGSSCLLVYIYAKIFLIDKGFAFEGSGANRVKTLAVGGDLGDLKLDAIIITHVHADHAGDIIRAILANPDARVVLSKKTLEEMYITLDDSLTIHSREKEKALLLGTPVPAPLFTEEEAETFLYNAENGEYEIVDVDTHDEGECFTWDDWPGWKFGFTSSGHTAGAMWSFIVTPDNDCLSHTGDICSHDQENTKGILMPKESFLTKMGYGTWRRTYFITEATNSNRDRTETQEEMDARFKAEIEDTFRRGGTVLCPVFMVNRGPNIVTKLVRLGFNVYVAGKVRETLAVEVGAEVLTKWVAEGRVMLAKNGPGQRERNRAIVNGEHGPRVIVCSSAMLDQGASTSFAIMLLPGKENLLVSTGHRFSGSKMEEVFKVQDQPLELGRTIVFESTDRLGQTVKTPVNFRCRAEHFDYSAHDYRKGLVARAVALKPDVVFVKHCTEEGFNGFESGLREALGKECPPVERLVHMHLCEL